MRYTIDWDKYRFLEQTKKFTRNMTPEERDFYIYMENMEEYRSGLGGDEE